MKTKSSEGDQNKNFTMLGSSRISPVKFSQAELEYNLDYVAPEEALWHALS